MITMSTLTCNQCVRKFFILLIMVVYIIQESTTQVIFNPKAHGTGRRNSENRLNIHSKVNEAGQGMEETQGL